MRIINSTSSHLQFTDFDRGNVGESRGVYEFWNAKASNGVEANGFIDVLDTEDVLLSAELGQIKKYKDAGWIDTAASLASNKAGTFTIETGVNDEFNFVLEGEGAQAVTLPQGDLTAAEVVTAINNAATATGGFSAEVVTVFRSSFQDDVVEGSFKVEGDLGWGNGERTEGVLEFIVLVYSAGSITIDAGNANGTLGFYEKDFTKVL